MEVASQAQTTESQPTIPAESTNSAATPEVSTADTALPTSEVTVPPEYQPNFKFKTMDKELEFEDWAKGIVKDKETEEKVRKLHLKAYGLESVQASRENLRTENQKLKSSLSENEKTINQVIGFAQTGDFDSFCKVTNVPIEKLLQFAVSYAQRTPAEQKSVEDKWQFQQEQSNYLQRLQQAEERAQQAELRERERDLSFVLSKPDVAEIAASFDARLNQPGAFRQEVIRRGLLHYQQTGEDLSPELVVGEVLKYFGPFVQPSMDGQQHTGATGATTPKVVTPNQKPTIPNISGRGASIVKKAPRSIEDLRKLSSQLSSAG